MIRIRGLSRRYGAVVALDGLSLEVAAGEIVALIGSNGAGKSTCLKALVGLVRPDAGELAVDGVDVRRRPLEGRARMGYLPQDVAFPARMTGRQVLDLFRSLRRLAAGETGRAIASVGLQGAADRPVAGYSGGMRQRLALAAALLGRPPALVLDEPAISLDPLFHAELRAILREVRERGSAVLLTSHLLPEVEAVADRIALLREGRLLAHGTLAELAASRGLRPLARFHVPGGNGAARRVLTAAGAHPTEEGDGWITLADAAPARAEAFRALEAAGLRVQAFETVPVGLADVFRAWYDADEGDAAASRGARSARAEVVR
ncbi:MAG TPA: ABC transporter ATP-binding protein [Gemmatimonadota bacterium]